MHLLETSRHDAKKPHVEKVSDVIKRRVKIQTTERSVMQIRQQSRHFEKGNSLVELIEFNSLMYD